MYLKIVNNNPIAYSLRQLKAENPDVSFPKSIPSATLALYDVYAYTRPDVPSFDANTQQVIDGSFEQDAEGAWSYTYSVTNLPEQEAAHNVRNERDKRLSETDYLALSDNTLTSAMRTYRQSLRDITDQSGFPFSVTWPTKPE